MVERLKTGKKGAMLVGPHLSNFELSIQILGHYGLDALVLSFPQPPAAYRLQNKTAQHQQNGNPPDQHRRDSHGGGLG